MAGELGKKLRSKGAQAALLLAALVIVSGSFFPLGDSASTQQKERTTAASAQEKRIGEVLSLIEGAGQVEVVIQYAEEAPAAGSWMSPPQTGGSGAIAAAIVVAEGAGDVEVRLKLSRAVETLLGLDAGAVAVFEMGKENSP